MVRFKILVLTLLLAASASLCASSTAQSSQIVPRHQRKATPRPMPFPPGGEVPAQTLEFRPFSQMSPQDRDLAADAESAIGERAGFAGLEFNEGQWSYQQVVCSALPNHLFLQFTRNNGAGDVSVFSASIPRSSEGRVRIIPIQRRGYSLFAPAPINALTISAFNHIRAEEQIHETQAWLATGLCYAALAGAHPQMGPAEESDLHKLPAAPTGKLFIPLHGGAVIRFTDTTPARKMEWVMTFNGKGKLLKATHSAAPRAGDKVAQRTPTEVQGRPVEATNPETKAILIK
jgi:hypothetical protein